MNILMMTNTYKPYVGGVERSVTGFTEELRRMGHRVVIVAPESNQESVPADETDVIRVPAITNFSESNLPILLPIPGILHSHLEKFRPDLVHSHFPFLIGGTAVRISARFEIPLVFTYHTMYEKYIHYVSLKSESVRNFVIEVVLGYCNLCDLVIAPSQSMYGLLKKRRIATEVETIPTGVNYARFAEGDGARCRKRLGIPADAFLLGHAGRLAPEKNLEFLARAAAAFLKQQQKARFLVIGKGESRTAMEDIFRQENLLPRVIFAGKQKGQDLVDGYHAMDAFAFSSLTETQGLVLLESMAAGVPVVALSGPGVNDVIRHGENGFMIAPDDLPGFAAALKTVSDQDPSARKSFAAEARSTAESFSTRRCAEKLIAAYHRLTDPAFSAKKSTKKNHWEQFMHQCKAEWELFRNVAVAAGHTIIPDKWHKEEQ